MDVRLHYDMLIDEGNDPFRDPPELKAYMSKWDGEVFFSFIKPEKNKRILEVGVGTGRLALGVLPHCGHFVGIDISPKTIERAKENLKGFSNAELICIDFYDYEPKVGFDIVYSSLSSMHFENKAAFVRKIASVMNTGGVLVISLDKNQSEFIDMGSRRLRIYPDNAEEFAKLIAENGMKMSDRCETENAHILVARK